MSDLVKELLARLVAGQSLQRPEARDAMREVMSGEVSPVLIAALLTALRAKGETPEEVAGMAEAMREVALPVPGDFGDLLDTCGTGGDRAGTFNISTAAAFVVAAAGVKVAKHGNRSATSRSGGADVLEALGVNIDLAPDAVARCLEQVGVAFLFAPRYNPAMRHVAPVRRELGFPTVFNLLGPLCNPMRPTFQIMGVFRKDLQDLAAGALCALGIRRALVVHGDGGLDELALSGPSRVLDVQDGTVDEYPISPEDLGLSRAPLTALAGGDARDNARLLRAILDGSMTGPARDVVVFNAAAGLVAAGRCDGFPQAAQIAAEALNSGSALAKMQALIDVSRD